MHGLPVPGRAQVAPVQRPFNAQHHVQVQVPVAARGQWRFDCRQVTLDRREGARDLGEFLKDQAQVLGQIARCDIWPGEHAGMNAAGLALLLPAFHRVFVAAHQAALLGARAVRAQQRHAALAVPGNHQLAGAAIDTPGAAVPAGAQLQLVVFCQQRVALDVVGELLADGAALAEGSARAVACLVDVRIDVGAVRGHQARGRRIGRQRIERAVRWREPVWQAIRVRIRGHPGDGDFVECG